MARRGSSPKRLRLFPTPCGAADKGAILSRERMAPLAPKRTQGALPLDPAIAGLQLEGLHVLRSVGAVYMASP